MQKQTANILEYLRCGPVMKARVFLLCLITLFGSVSIANHVHEIAEAVQADSFVDTASDGDQTQDQNLALDALVANDCDLFHINSLAIFQPVAGLEKYRPLQYAGRTAQSTVDSISPELHPPSRAPPSGISLT